MIVFEPEIYLSAKVGGITHVSTHEYPGFIEIMTMFQLGKNRTVAVFLGKYHHAEYECPRQDLTVQPEHRNGLDIFTFFSLVFHQLTEFGRRRILQACARRIYTLNSSF